MATVKDIDAILPQTQCQKCGYDDCFAYAKAIHNGEKHNKCPPGGQRGVQKLANLLNREELPLDPEHGEEKPRKVAVINEDLCIGCTLCIDACPVDAIVGSKKQMHSVIEQDCTGCELCVSPCPMDCIDLVTLPEERQPAYQTELEQQKQADHHRQQHYQKIQRQQNQKQQLFQTYQKNRQTPANYEMDKKDYIQQALKSFRAKKAHLKTSSES
jgi:electron transport complex protein RnfB